MRLEPELTIPCPACKAPKGQPCISRYAIRIHEARRSALQALERQSDRLLRGLR